MEVPELRFATTRRGRIAYQQWGDGVDVVAVPPLAQNVELVWQWPAARAMLERFGQMSRFLHYDKPGTGASDRIRSVPTLDERVEDMQAVMDHAGVERAWLQGNSDGGPTALLFAATWPERVHGVILLGSGATTVTPGLTDAELRETLERQRVAAARWGTPDSPVVDRFAPSLAGDPAYRAWHQRYERACCDSATLYDLLTMSLTTDVSEVLPRVHCPVVLLHRTGDRAVEVARAHEAAALLPDARVVEFPGEDHFGYAGDADAWLDEQERVLTGAVRVSTPAPPRPATRVVTLGRFAVEHDGRPVPLSEWGSRHARTIVKRLAVARGWPVRREELFELLWPGEHDRARLGARLSVQLSTVRRVLRGGLVADRDTVRLDLEEVALDLVDLDAAEDDTAVLAVVGGPFLPADADLAWTGPTRAEVQARAAVAAARVARRDLDAGLPDQAAATARRLVDADQHDLRGHELLVAALLAAEQHEQAVRAHAAWVEAADALGVQVPPLEPT